MPELWTLGIMGAFADKLTFDRRSVLHILVGVYLFPLYLVCFSLSVPPADLPLCGLLLVLAVVGYILARRESRRWRIFWIAALIFASVSGVLEIVAGRHIAQQRQEHSMMPNNSLQATAAGHRVFGGVGDSLLSGFVRVQFLRLCLSSGR